MIKNHINFAIRITIALMNMSLSFLVVKLADNEGVATYFIALTYAYLFGMFFSYGFNGVVARKIPKILSLNPINEASDLAGKIFSAIIIWAFLIFSMALIVESVVDIFDFLKIKDRYLLAVVCSWALSFSLQNFISEVLRANSKHIASTVFSGGLSSLLSMVALCVKFYIDSRKLEGLSVIEIFTCSTVLQNITALIIYRNIIRFKLIGLNIFIKYLKDGFLYFLNSFFSYVLMQGVGLLVVGNMTNQDISSYGIFNRVTTALMMYGSVMFSMLSPKIVELHSIGDIGRLESVIRLSAKNVFLVTLIVSLPLLIFPAQLISLIFGHEYSYGYLSLVIMCLSVLVNIFTGIRGQLLLLTGYEGIQLRITVLTGISSFVLSYALIATWGLVGAAASVLLFITMQCVLEMIMVHRSLKIKTFAHF
jgi:O-antigen/teichoic acid export membrane protein